MFMYIKMYQQMEHETLLLVTMKAVMQQIFPSAGK